MTKDELLNQLRMIAAAAHVTQGTPGAAAIVTRAGCSGPDACRTAAESLLLAFIADPDIAEAFDEVIGLNP